MIKKPRNKNYKNTGTRITKIREQKFKKNWEQKLQKSGNKNDKKYGN
jgi:hypothetical protein